MTTRFTKFSVAAATLAFLLLLPATSLASISAKLITSSNGAGTKMYRAGSPAMSGSTHVGTNNAGLFTWELTSVGPDFQGPITPASYFYSFCIELTQGNISKGTTYTFDVVDPTLAPVPGSPETPISALGEMLLAELWYAHFGKVLSGVSGYTTAEVVGAFQLAVWEVVYESDATLLVVANRNVSPTNGDLYGNLGSSAERTLANEWLQSLTANGTGTKSQIWALSSPASQDQLVNILGGDFFEEFETEEAPEPASLVVWSLGLIGVVVAPRVRRAWRRAG